MATIYRKWFPCTITLEQPHGKGYVGYTYRTLEERDKQRFSDKNDSVALKHAIVKYRIENMQTDTIEEILPIHDLVCEREKYWIAHFDDYYNGYNRTKGGDGVDSETARETNRKLIENGTHNFLGENNPVHKMIEDGTHHLLGGKIHRKRVENGTHHFLGGDIQRKAQRKLVENGTHHFLGGEITRKNNRKLVEAGAHIFCRENHPKARPEYYEVYREFILSYPLGIKEARKHLRKKFSDVKYATIWDWTNKWQAELQIA